MPRDVPDRPHLTRVAQRGILSTMRAQQSHLTPPGIFGQRVRELREQRGLTQAELGRRAGFDRTTINKIERGSRGDVTISQLFTFAEALGTSPIYLLTPNDPDVTVQLAPGGRALSGWEARAWIRGTPPLGKKADLPFFKDLPQDEVLGVVMRHPRSTDEALTWLAAFLAVDWTDEPQKGGPKRGK